MNDDFHGKFEGFRREFLCSFCKIDMVVEYGSRYIRPKNGEKDWKISDIEKAHDLM